MGGTEHETETSTPKPAASTAAEDSSLSPPAIESISPGENRPIAFERLKVLVSELPEQGQRAVEEVQSFLSRHASLIEDQPKLAQVIYKIFGRQGERVQSCTLSRVVAILDGIAASVEPTISFSDDLPASHRERMEKLVSGIIDYMRMSNISLPQWARCSCHGKAHKRLTAYLRQKGIITKRDVVEIRGDKGAAMRHGHVQIGISDEETENVTGSWFIWNCHDGGYYRPTADSHSFHFQARLETGDFESVGADVARVKDVLTHLFDRACTQSAEFSRNALLGVETIPVEKKLAGNLGLVCYAKRPWFGHTGSYQEGALLGRSQDLKEDGGTFYSIGHIINEHQITNQSRYGEARGWNVDLVREFTAPLSLQAIYDRQDALKALSDSHESLARDYIRHFVGGVGPYQSSLSKVNILPWLLLAHQDGGGYTGWIQYQPRDFISGLKLMTGKMEGLAKASPEFGRLAGDFNAYLKSDACRELETLVAGGRGDRFDDYGMSGPVRSKQKGRKAYDFDDGFIIPRSFAEGDGYIRRDGRSDLLTKVWAITNEHEADIAKVWEAMRRMEYLLVWARFFSTLSVPTVFPVISPDAEALEIIGGRNLPLVLHKENPAEEVIANSIRLDDTQRAIIITGGNGAGKTHFLEMISNCTVDAHKALKVCAESMKSPLMTHFDYSVNASVHSETASSFQSDVINLISVLQNLDKRIPGEHGLLIYDELGRGTDVRDGLSLYIGVLRYLDRRNIYFAGSTHFNVIGSLAPLLREYGLRIGLYTMEHDTFRLIPGAGESGGINVAEKVGLDSEIIGYARTIVAQHDAKVVRLDTPPTPNAQTTAPSQFFLGSSVAEELGMFEVTASSWEVPKHKRLSSASRVFAEHSAFRSDEYHASGLRSHLPQLRPVAASIFVRMLCDPLTDEERADRLVTIGTLEKSNALNSMEESLGALEGFDNLFNIYQDKKRTQEDLLEECLAVGVGAAQRIQDEKIDHTYFLHAVKKTSIETAYRQLERLVAAVEESGLPSCAPIARRISSFLESPEGKELREYARNNKFLYKAEREDEFLLDDWKRWVNQCVPLQETLIDLWRGLIELDFYAAVSRTVRDEKWITPEEREEEGFVSFKGLRNTRLQYIADEVTPIDVTLWPDLGGVYISGTNGGGKTQALQALGAALFFHRQIGRVPADTAAVGTLGFMSVMLTSSQHSLEASSFQNEVRRIDSLVEEYRRCGEPRNGIVLLDEPGKGTSEEEAVPLVAALDHFFSQRDVRVVATTHYSGLFDVLPRIEGGKADSIALR